MDIKVPLPDGRIESFTQLSLLPFSQEASSVQFYSPIVVSSSQPVLSKASPKLKCLVFILTANNIYFTEDPPKKVIQKIPLESVVEIIQVFYSHLIANFNPFSFSLAFTNIIRLS